MKAETTLESRVLSRVDDGGSVCEDLTGATADTVWVLDGASGAVRENLTDAPSDGRWYVEQFDNYLTESEGASAPLPEVVRRGVRRVGGRLRTLTEDTELTRVRQPLTAGAVLRARDGWLEYLLSADCNLALQRPDGRTEVIRGDGPRSLDASVLESIQRLKQNGGLSHEVARRRTRNQIVENRRQLNTPGGYWALSVDTRAVDHARGSTLNPASVDRIALYTDGFERLTELYEAVGYSTIFERAEEGSLAPLFEKLRSVESSDPNCEQYPRTKPSDDAALSVVDIPDRLGSLSR